MDTFYTPPHIAERIVKLAQDKRPYYVADFAAGDGSLLRAAQLIWPKSIFIATDISQVSVSKLKIAEPTWRVGRCNFLSETSRRCSKTLSEMKGKASLVLLNPPFSYRGGSYQKAAIGGSLIPCSIALAFMFISVQFLSQGGQIVAILPAGSLYSDKDKIAWKTLNSIGISEVLDSNNRNTFSGCFPRTVVVRFTKIPITKKRAKTDREPLSGIVANHVASKKVGLRVKIFRGKVQMHDASVDAAIKKRPFVHSTELEQTGLNLSRRRIDAQLKGIRGPAVLLPRVGLPNKFKILTYLRKRPIVLSDCVIAL